MAWIRSLWVPTSDASQLWWTACCISVICSCTFSTPLSLCEQNSCSEIANFISLRAFCFCGATFWNSLTAVVWDLSLTVTQFWCFVLRRLFLWHYLWFVLIEMTICYQYLLLLSCYLQCFDTVGWTWGADTMSIKQKTTKPLCFPVVLWHYRLSGRKDIWLIKIQWLFQ